MSTVRAYYDGLAFVPIEPVNVKKGIVVSLSILGEGTQNPEVSRRLAAFRKLTGEIHELNLSEPITSEFDEIISRGVRFKRELEL